jgi:hypothetical protein
MTALTDRERKALAAISMAGPAGVGTLDIGRAAVRGEHRDAKLDADAKRTIGREVAEALMRDGFARTCADRYVLPHFLRGGH